MTERDIMFLIAVIILSGTLVTWIVNARRTFTRRRDDPRGEHGRRATHDDGSRDDGPAGTADQPPPAP